ncbi:MAG: hypothetical protein K2O44_04560 [Clostridia bacterium]|nr:hypothetical protein [Clostridia bacterium]
MNIKETILHYLFVYGGEYESAMERVKNKLFRGLSRKEQAQMDNSIFFAFEDLKNKKNIELITCEKMTAEQLRKFNTEGKTFYRIINKSID